MIKECDEFRCVVDEAVSKLKHNDEWIKRFADYAKAVNGNIQKIKDKKKQFHEWSPLHLYMNVAKAKSSAPTFSLRYLGQDVANLIVQGSDVLLNTKEYSENNNKYFECNIALGKEIKWQSKKAASFRKYFKEHFLSFSKMKNIENKNGKRRGNKEHRIESMLLTEFSKSHGKSGELHNIQPIKIARVARFQMPTPFGASGNNVKFAKKGGGVDILARVGKGRSTKLCVMELKNKYSQPVKVLKQGLIYAVFIRELLRSESGKEWWNIFGRSGDVPGQLVLYVACVMPFNKKGESDKSFGNQEILLGRDLIKLHYLYFEEDKNKIKKVETSLGGK